MAKGADAKLKKLIGVGVVVIALFAIITVLSNQSNKEKLKNNPYGTDNLAKSTIDLIGNKDYSNIILPEELFEKIKSGEPVTAYYFHPECQYCREMTPVIMPIAKEMGVDVHQYNMLEFGKLVNESTDYKIDAWPALVYYENGEEIGRMVGAQPEENIRLFFEEFSK